MMAQILGIVRRANRRCKLEEPARGRTRGMIGHDMSAVGLYKLPCLWLDPGVEDEFSVFNLQDHDALHRIAPDSVVVE